MKIISFTILFLTSAFFQAQKPCGFIDGLQEGNCIFYYDTGQKKWDQNWKKGKLDGEYVAYFENGKVKAQGVYKKDKKIGEWVYFDEKGMKTGTEKYKGWKGDVYKDECNVLYFKNNKIETTGKFVNGKHEGLWKSFYESGKLKCEYNKVNGNTEGEMHYYKEDGNVEKTEIYKTGKLISKK